LGAQAQAGFIIFKGLPLDSSTLSKQTPNSPIGLAVFEAAFDNRRVPLLDLTKLLHHASGALCTAFKTAENSTIGIVWPFE